jgi:aspartate racemase
MGPLAGAELFRKVIQNVDASSDQEHPPVVLMSYPHRLPDRTAYLTGVSADSPGPAIANILRSMDRLGVAVAGIPCNTAHAPQILNGVLREMRRHNCQLRFVHMIDEAIRMVREHYPSVSRVGVLSTRGTRRTRLYSEALSLAGYELVELDDDVHDSLAHRAVYDPVIGIKATRSDFSEARGLIAGGVGRLSDLGADAVILGCTELPLALADRFLDGIPLIDPSTALARALLREALPERLVSWKAE